VNRLAELHRERARLALLLAAVDQEIAVVLDDSPPKAAPHRRRKGARVYAPSNDVQVDEVTAQEARRKLGKYR
jgi:hypothetical protein